MRRARKTWAQIAEEQAQFQAVDQKPPGWTARKKAHAQSEQQVARAKARISELLGLVGNAIRVAQPSFSPLPTAAARFLRSARPLAGSQLSGIRFVGLTSGTR